MLKLIIAIVCLVLTIILFKSISLNDNDGIAILKISGGVLAALAAFVLTLLCLWTPLEFRTWEKSFEIQRANYEALSQQDNSKTTLILMADILEANKDLAEWQSYRATWGAWSSVPARVMDIKPIGITDSE